MLFALVCDVSPKLRQCCGSATENAGCSTVRTVNPSGIVTA
jgi:hypothetical protein